MSEEELPRPVAKKVKKEEEMVTLLNKTKKKKVSSKTLPRVVSALGTIDFARTKSANVIASKTTEREGFCCCCGGGVTIVIAAREDKGCERERERETKTKGKKRNVK